MALVNVEEATRRFEEKLKSGYFKPRREEAHRLAKMFEPDEDYSLHKEQRDTDAVCEFAHSDTFKELIGRLN